MFLFQLDKLAALDFFPILLLGKKCKGSLVADVILGGDYILDPDLLQRVKVMYEAVLKSKSFFFYKKKLWINLKILVILRNTKECEPTSIIFFIFLLMHEHYFQP